MLSYRYFEIYSFISFLAFLDTVFLQALKLFRICDENEKGFIVKADLAKIDGFINEMPIEKLESFFDNIDTSKTNIVTESQFIDNISSSSTFFRSFEDLQFIGFWFFLHFLLLLTKSKINTNIHKCCIFMHNPQS